MNDAPGAAERPVVIVGGGIAGLAAGYELHKRGISNKEMYTTLNCGIGFVLSVAPADAKKILREVKGSLVIGKVQKGNREIRIQSVFDGKRINV